MSKHTEAIRAALAKNPTLGAWIAELGEAYVVRSQADGGRVAICTNLRGFHGMGGRRDGDEVAANAHLIAACNPVNVAALLAERDELLSALCSIGVIGPGYCFCSHDRDPDKTDHQPECADARAAIRKATED